MNFDLDALKSNEEVNTYDFKEMFNKAYVDLSEELQKPEILISIGEHYYKNNYYPTSAMTSGEFSAIVAPSKSKKSFLKSALIASYIGADASSLFPNITSHRVEDYTIIDIDTEQGKYYTQRTFRRVPEMTGLNYEHYKGFATRSFDSDERLAFIEYLLENQKTLFKKPIKLLSIDGIADLVDDTNDIVMSKKVADKITKWTDIYNIHITTVIHKLSGSNKPVGHLGSFVTKKAETVMLLEFDEQTKNIVVSNPYSRGYQFDSFQFNVNSDALPYQVTDAPINTNNNVGF